MALKGMRQRYEVGPKVLGVEFPRMFKDFPNGWWILPGVLLGSFIWLLLICLVVRALFAPDLSDVQELATQLEIILAAILVGHIGIWS